MNREKKIWLLERFYEHISENRREKFENIVQDRTRHICVVLEDIFQPHNAAAVLRSCDCFGVQDLHYIEGRNEFEPDKEVDMGSSKWINIHNYPSSESNTEECIEGLRAKGYQIVATTPHTDNLISDLDISKPTALLFGTELTGLTEKAIEMADASIKLPMYGFTESYNISVSVALALYDVTHRMRSSDSNDWKLSEDERLDLLLDWCRKTVKKPEILESILSERFENQ